MNPKLMMMCLMSALTAIFLASADAAEEKNAKTEDRPDKKFILAAAQGGMLEVRLGELAEKKAVKPEIKSFGAMMASDHGQVNGELKAVAEKLGVTIPKELKGKGQKNVEKLDALSGAEFDSAYVAEMVKAHTRDAAAFEEASKTSSDPNVKAFAAKTLPVIKSHLEKINAISASLGEPAKAH